MNIDLQRITIKDLFNGYENDVNKGVVGYGGKLNIRPAYQREFVYKNEQQAAVIESIQRDFPLNVMYWAKNKDDSFEMLDGQQRTISICEYLSNNFTIKNVYDNKRKYFHGLGKTGDKAVDQILNYELMVYFCDGDPAEKLNWFKIINIAGEKLTDQELLNAMYCGPWVSDAKRHFSKNNCAAYGLASQYLKGSAIRQHYLETAIKWINNNDIENYMADFQDKPNANELWLHFQAVISWVKVTFIKYRKEMKGIDYGTLYNKFKDENFDSEKIELEIKALMQDDDVTNKRGIYEYVLSGNESKLNIRGFTDNQKREAYEKQNGICAECKVHFELNEMEADHITPWHEGGKTNPENCQMLCKDDNRRKSGK